MAAFLEEHLGIEAELVGGSGGIFDVAVDGTVVYSKDDTGRFPDHEEVRALIEQRT